jgi:hypothetical protein
LGRQKQTSYREIEKISSFFYNHVVLSVNSQKSSRARKRPKDESIKRHEPGVCVCVLCVCVCVCVCVWEGGGGPGQSVTRTPFVLKQSERTRMDGKATVFVESSAVHCEVSKLNSHEFSINKFAKVMVGKCWNDVHWLTFFQSRCSFFSPRKIRTSWPEKTKLVIVSTLSHSFVIKQLRRKRVAVHEKARGSSDFKFVSCINFLVRIRGIVVGAATLQLCLDRNPLRKFDFIAISLHVFRRA